MKVLLIFATLAVSLVSSQNPDRAAFDIGFIGGISNIRRIAQSTFEKKKFFDEFTVNPFYQLNYPGGSPPENLQIQYFLGLQALVFKIVYAYDRIYPQFVPELPLTSIGQDLGDFKTQLAIARKTGSSDINYYLHEGAKSLDKYKTVFTTFFQKPNGPYGTDPSPSQTLSQLQNAYNQGMVDQCRKVVQAYDLVFNNNQG